MCEQPARLLALISVRFGLPRRSKVISSKLFKFCAELKLTVLTHMLCIKTDNSVSLKFSQRYLSPVFEDFQSLVIEPETNNLHKSRHRVSSSVCKGVCENGYIIWANSRGAELLVGSDIPFHTVVGVPICSVGNDLYILVAFAVKHIVMTPTAVDYFNCFVRAVAKKTGGFLSTSFSDSLTSPPASHKFEGRSCEIETLVEKYSKSDDAHVLAKGTVHKYPNSNEVKLVEEFFADFKSSRPRNFTQQQLNSLRNLSRNAVSSASAESVSAGPAMLNQSEISGAISLLHQKSSSASDAGAYCAGNAARIASGSLASSSSSDVPSPQYYAHSVYGESQSRLHELMIALLGITVFDSIELWLLDNNSECKDATAELQLTAAVYRTAVMQTWVQAGAGLRLPVGCDVPGKVVQEGKSCWEHPYIYAGASESGAGRIQYPREATARSLGIHTAFGVPIIGAQGSIGALVLFASALPAVESGPDPVLLQLVETALSSIATPQGETTGASSASVVALPAVPDFARRLEHCREVLQAKKSLMGQENAIQVVPQGRAHSIKAEHLSMNGKATSTAKSRGDGVLRTKNYCHSPSSSDDDEDLTEEQVLGMRASSFTSAPSQAAKVTTAAAFPASLHKPIVASSVNGSSAAVVESDATGAAEDAYPDAVVNAARALANFGNFQWGTFLEGSGIEENNDGYTSMRLGSDKILDMYGVGRDGASRKRKHERLARPSNGTAGEESSIPVCLVDGCHYTVEPDSQYCSAHHGTRRCQKEGCGKCAQGATKFCIAHGGGRRCTYPGCFKGARDKLFCAAHGGGKRCTFENCTKSAVGGSLLCTAHGGGKRCKFEGCNKSSQSSTDFCVKHGGGRSCMFKGCNKVNYVAKLCHNFAMYRKSRRTKASSVYQFILR